MYAQNCVLSPERVDLVPCRLSPRPHADSAEQYQYQYQFLISIRKTVDICMMRA